MLRFGQKEVTTKEFYGQRQIADIFMIDVNRMLISDKVSCNNEKDCRYVVGYQLDEVLIPLFIKTPKNVFSDGVSQYDKNSAYTMSFNIFEEKASRKYQLFEKMETEPIKRENRYVNGNLKTWKERKKTDIYDQDVLYNMHCNATC